MEKEGWIIQRVNMLWRYSRFSAREVLWRSKIIGVFLKWCKNYLKESLVKILSSGVVGSTWISLPRDLFILLPFRWIIVGFKLNIYFGSIPYPQRWAVSIHIFPPVNLIKLRYISNVVFGSFSNTSSILSGFVLINSLYIST